MVFVGVSFGQIGNWYREYTRQFLLEEVIADYVHERHGKIEYRWVGPMWIHRWKLKKWFPHCVAITEVEFCDAKVNDDDLLQVSRCIHLRSLRVFIIKAANVGEALPITDKGISYLFNLPKLRELRISDSLATGKNLARLQNLYSLDMRISRDCLDEVFRLPCLAYLDLSGTSLSDSDLVNLVALPQLSSLTAYNTNITPNGVMELRESLPHLQVYYSTTKN